MDNGGNSAPVAKEKSKDSATNSAKQPATTKAKVVDGEGGAAPGELKTSGVGDGGQPTEVKPESSDGSAKTDPSWLKKYETCEEVAATNGDGAKKHVTKETGDGKTVVESKGGEPQLKTEDTLILELDNADNLDVYLEKTKGKAGANATVADSAKTKEIGTTKTVSEGEVNGKDGAKKKPANKKIDGEAEDKTEPSPPQKGDGDSKENPRKNDPPEKKLVDEKPSDDSVAANKSEDKKADPRFIWISNISKSTKASDLKLHLSSYGKVVTARIVTDGKLYYGYVVMDKRDDVDNCIKHLDDSTFEGRKIRLSNKVPEKKPNRNPNAEQTPIEGEKESEKGGEDAALKPSKDKQKPPQKFRRSRSHDPLTLKVRRYDRFSDEDKRRRQKEELLRRAERERRSQEQQKEMAMRRREMEREHEERRRQKIKDEERRQAEMKLERERRKLEREREEIEKEKLDLIRLQKKLADSERTMLNRQKVEMERSLRSITEDYKKRRAGGPMDEFAANRKSKFPRPPDEVARRMPDGGGGGGKEYWKSEQRMISPVKVKSECFTVVESYQKKPGGRDDSVCMAPPPPILSDNFDLSDRRRKDKEREWDGRGGGYGGGGKKEFVDRGGGGGGGVFKEPPKVFERKVENNRGYGFGVVQEKPSYGGGRERYKPKEFAKYEKAPQATGSWEKFSTSTPSYKSAAAPSSSSSSSSSWTRPVQRHAPSGFPAPPQFGSSSGGITHYFAGPEGYARQSNFYARPPDRKY